MQKELKMKQSKFIIFLLIFIFSLSSCGTSAQQDNSVTKENNSTETELENKESEKLEESSVEVENKWFFFGTDLDGNEISSKELLAEADLTLVNIWATYCGPCKVELPDLALISENYADKNVKVLGIAADIAHGYPETIELAEEILKEAGVNYVNFTFNEEISEKVLSEIYAVPTSLLIDSNANVIGEPLIGTKSYDEFSYYIDLALEDIE